MTRTRIPVGGRGAARTPAARTGAARTALVASAAVLALLLAASAVVALVMIDPGPHPAGVERALLSTDIVGGPVPVVVFFLAALALIAVLVRPWRRGPLLLTVSLAVIGGVGGAVLVAVASNGDWFGVSLDGVTAAWVAAAFAGVGAAIGATVRARAWQRITAVTAALLALIAGTIGVNAEFGLQRTVADFAGVTLSTHVKLPHPVASASASSVPTLAADLPLWSDWHPPKDMPTSGTTGTVTIPATHSGFAARSASVYLPPAALVANAPTLPLAIVMMGQPGNPDPSFVAAALNAFAAKHDGLAPIVVVADQLGNPAHDTLCLNTSRYGNVETYITQDVLDWARSHLRVDQDAAHTIVAGYSNGGECALYFGAKYPQLFGNVVDISGELYAGGDKPSATLAQDFGGNAAAYRATWPSTYLAQQHYADTTGVFTVGSSDAFYGRQAKQAVADTIAAGWASTLTEIPGGHVGVQFVQQSFATGFAGLATRLGLASS